jgi:hypothetical protein
MINLLIINDLTTLTYIEHLVPVFISDQEIKNVLSQVTGKH